VVAGVGRAAKNGILIKGGSTLERFAQSRTIIFDKTGTLTSGNFEATWVENKLGERAAALVKGLESHSSHPIAKALLRHWPEVDAEVLENVRETKGKGISGTTQKGEKVSLGASQNQVEGPKADLDLQVNDVTLAKLLIKDDIKPGAREMINLFRKEGLTPVILSGDKKDKVLATAMALGIDQAHFEMSPQAKLEFIEGAADTDTVAMVGDGINDGPALSRAQVGISPKGASALAIDSARIAIMNPDEMESIAKAYLISKHTYLTIKQNLFWAFFYNILTIPLAALGFLNPMVAALAMAFSDVVVIGNSLRLKVKKLR
jgi:Cu+-exporting ATPase